MSKLLIILLVALVLVGGAYLIISGLKNSHGSDKQITITVWGVKDNEQVMNNVIVGFKKLHPNITVNYIVQNPLNYRTRVQTQIESGQGPDVLAVHNSWVQMFLNGKDLAPAPAEVFSSGDFGQTFYKVASESFITGGKVYGIPSEVDGIALFYNEDILKGQGVGVPKSWDDLVSAAAKLKVVDKEGNLTTGGLGIGNTDNVDNWSEILGMLFFQEPNVDITQVNSEGGKAVLSFYKVPTQDQTTPVWSPAMDPTTKAFAQGKLAFYLGPSSMVAQIKQQNSNLHFSVIPVPQLPDKSADMACFWGYGVSSKSKNPTAAWEFLHFLSDKATEQYIYQQETQIIGSGRPFARVDLQDQLVKDKYLGAFVQQGPLYKTFYLCSDTGDLGINDEMIKAFKDGVDANDLTQLSQSEQAILNKYSATSPSK